ncbi:DUF2802 domain-containing protein [Halioxenophilus aromaticivorans]|uniref:DUF2802 domain-containing protein n=1 Tax=Halioxenophilus aromaticivorans TaxID=1306992 RepID=A0AAV3U0N6_9ALTE
MDISTLSIYLVVIAVVAALALIGNVVLWRQFVLLEQELEKNASSIEKEGQITYLSHMSTDKKLQMFEQRLRALAEDPMLEAQKAPAAAPVSLTVPPAPVQPEVQTEHIESDEVQAVEALLADAVSAARTNEPASSLSNASSLFEQGVDSEEVARRCGLTRAEAELMALVQNKTKIAS